MRAQWIAVSLLLAAGCQVSVFGGEPVTLIGRDTQGGTQARACGEPDDARRARERADACMERCRIEPGATSVECDAVSLDTPRAGVAELDLGSADGLVMTLEICDPSGVVLQLSDSPTAEQDGGDAQTSAHDADLILNGTTLTVRASEAAGVEPSTISSFVPASGCERRTLVLADQIVYFAETDVGLCGTGMLRVHPPTDAEGAPDAKWYLALAGSVDGTGSGGGVRSVELCFW